MESTSKTNSDPWPYRGMAQVLPLLVAAIACAFYAQFWLSHDDSWYLIATRKFLDGARLYIDIMEVNPPLNFYLTVPALLLAEAIGITDTLAYVIQTCVLGGLSGLWLVRLLRRSDLAGRERWAILIPALVGLFLLPIGEFAQREHLLFVYALPYLTYVILGSERVRLGAGEKILLGLVGTLGLALKPYFLLIPVAIILVGPVKSLMSRIFAPANLGLAAGLVAYALFTILVHPEFFSDILGVARRVYWAFGFSAAGVLLRGEIFAVLLFAYLFALGGVSNDRASRRFAAAVAAALVSYLVQFKGWNYQLIPLIYFLLAGSTWVAVEKKLFDTRQLVPQVVLLAIAVITLGTQMLAGPYSSRNLDEFAPYVEEPGETIMVYSTNVSAAFPFVNAVEGKWASRYPAQWTIPGAVIGLASERCPTDAEYCAPLQKILADIRSDNTQDFLRYRPDVVFVDMREDKSYFHGQAFDYLAFQLDDPDFAKSWANYRKVAEVGEGYAVFRRMERDAQ